MEIINQQQTGRFTRHTGHSLRLGVVVAYTLQGTNAPFQILVSREGVEIQGRINVGPEGIEIIRDILNRASKHHVHLKSFQIGEKQTILDEAQLYNESLEPAATGTVQ